MKPNSKIKTSMSGIDWDDDGEDSLPRAVERDYEASDFAGALSYDSGSDDYLFDEDVARDRVADLLSDEFGFCVNHVEAVEFSY